MLYATAKSIIVLLCRSYIRLEVIGHENIPESGGVLLAPNHISCLDPILLPVAVERRVYSMAKEELFENAFSRFLMTRVNAFPVRRGKLDRHTLRHSLQILGQGKVLNVFPEGTINLHGNVMEGKQGVAWLALKTNAPIVPVKIIGTDKLLPDGEVFPKMGRARIIFGRPIFCDAKGSNLKDCKKMLTETMMEEIRKLG